MQLKEKIRMLGPGLLFAGAAVGVSHLVQSTRAGASFGFELVWILIIANVLKYPFIEFGPRYANATGNSLIDGYRNTGKWALWLYIVITFATMFAIQAAVTVVTAGLFAKIFNLNLNAVTISAMMLVIAIIFLGIGRYAALDKIMKIVIVTLAISTIIAVTYAFSMGFFDEASLAGNFDWSNQLHIFFIISFIGWMPAPIDVSVWQSLWAVAKTKQLGKKPTLKQAMLDFNIGYIGAAVLAFGFLSLGALVMFGSGETLSDKGVVFADQLINMYTGSIGAWAYPLIAIAALTTMISTTITCLDAFPRVLRQSTFLALPQIEKSPKNEKTLYWFWIIIVSVGTLLLLSVLSGSMGFMVDLATTISFVTAPVLAILNFKVIMHRRFPQEAKPKKWLIIYAWAGIAFLVAFSLFYLIWMIF
jgi:Mn2+/Fe2+ NRAMP family transporter